MGRPARTGSLNSKLEDLENDLKKVKRVLIVHTAVIIGAICAAIILL
jgi:hypothetical protein